MVTEEIELNEALESDGRTVVETDLGEFIVQISGDRPSHIIAPVLHWTRQDVGTLFSDELNVPCTDVPTELNQIDRDRYERGQRASHDDSAAGARGRHGHGTDRSNAGGPRRRDPRQGRWKVLGDNISEALACIRCGACLNICPVYRSVGGHAYGDVYSGPIGAVLSPVLFGLDGREELPYACTLCGACLEVCPVRIDLPQMLVDLRARVIESGGGFGWLDPTMTAYRTVATHPALWRRTIGTVGLAGRTAKRGWFSRLPGPGGAWMSVRDLPAPASEPFRKWWRRHHGS